MNPIIECRQGECIMVGTKVFVKVRRVEDGAVVLQIKHADGETSEPTLSRDETRMLGPRMTIKFRGTREGRALLTVYAPPDVAILTPQTAVKIAAPRVTH